MPQFEARSWHVPGSRRKSAMAALPPPVPVAGPGAPPPAAFAGSAPFDPYAAAAPFAGPAGAVGPGLRTPYGPARQGSQMGPPDFLYNATGFRRGWGAPPSLHPALQWNPERYVYEPVLGRGELNRDAYFHYKRFAEQGLFVQPYRVSANPNLPAWQQWGVRLTRVPGPAPATEAPYEVVQQDPTRFLWQIPSRSRYERRPDPELEGLTPEQVEHVMAQRMEERYSQMAALPIREAGKYRLSDGRVFTSYGPEGMPDARMVQSWEEFLRDPSLGGRVTPGVGAGYWQNPLIVKQMIDKAGGPRPRPAMEPHPVGETREGGAGYGTWTWVASEDSDPGVGK